MYSLFLCSYASRWKVWFPLLLGCSEFRPWAVACPWPYSSHPSIRPLAHHANVGPFPMNDSDLYFVFRFVSASDDSRVRFWFRRRQEWKKWNEGGWRRRTTWKKCVLILFVPNLWCWCAFPPRQLYLQFPKLFEFRSPKPIPPSSLPSIQHSLCLQLQHFQSQKNLFTTKWDWRKGVKGWKFVTEKREHIFVGWTHTHTASGEANGRCGILYFVNTQSNAAPNSGCLAPLQRLIYVFMFENGLLSSLPLFGP